MDNSMKKRIFGKNLQFQFEKCIYSDVIKKELKLYPDADFEEDSTDYYIYVDEKNEANSDDKYGRNPKEVYVSSDNFCINYSWGIVSWSNQRIHISYNPNMYNRFAKIIRHVFDIQFYTQPEWAGQRLYEDILINMAFWDKNYFVLHGSGIADNNGNVVIIGGTGGTGKTSTVLSMRNREDRMFVCDDLCPVTRTGQVYVNYDMPKIYAYNVIGNPSMEKEILSDEGFISKVQWNVLKAGNPARVRRRVSPGKLYRLVPNEMTENLHLHTYLILNRTMQVDKVVVSPISASHAAEITVEIMRTEFAKFASFLNYYKLNGLYENANYVDSENCFQIWKQNMEVVFDNIQVKMVSIPFNYNNEMLKHDMNRLIDSILGVKNNESI